MNPFRTAAATTAAAIVAITIGLAATPSARALTIVHNGMGTGGVITDATEAVNVGLFDVYDEFPQSGAAELCGVNEVQACLGKAWLPGSQNDTHSMTIVQDGSTFAMLEFVFNATGQPWTDYHLDVTGADIIGVEAGFFLAASDASLGPQIPVSIDSSIADNSVWFLFDQPFVSPEVEPTVVFAFLLGLGNAGETVVIDQHPSIPEPGTLAIFGLGLAGLGFARRRKTA